MIKKYLLRGLFLFLGLGVLGGLTGLGAILYFSYDLPKISSLNDYKPALTSQILAKDGDVLAEIGKEKRELVEYEQIPQLIIDAFLSAEDANFYEHSGVDYAGVLRALIANIKAGRVVQGGSTITQQVAKSLLLTSERSITRKIKDFLLAQRIEKHFSKKEILYLYLNQVYLGGGFYGIKAAASGYYGKQLSDVTIAEAAMIAGLLVAPGRYSPYVNPQYAQTRQDYVLSRMYSNNKITEKEYQEALKEDIQYHIRRPKPYRAPFFTDWVRQRVMDRLGEDEFLTGGYRVQTTLDWPLQAIAEKEVEEGLKEIDKRQGFKGPLGQMTTEEEINEYILSFRKDLYESASEFFTINDEMERVYQYALSEDELELLSEHQREWNEELGKSRYFPGHRGDEDLAIQHLKSGELYEAVVTGTDDSARIIYASLGGIATIIPYQYFRWAHERDISTERKWHSYVTRPSTILKKGDVIHVSLVNKSASAYAYAQKSFQKLVDKHKKSDLIKQQRFLLCWLDQVPEVEGALLSLDPKNGDIVSFVGGRDFYKSQFNRVIQSRRQPGSAFKPLLYAAAIENGFTPASIIMDSPEALGGVDESLNWKPRNYDGKFKGPMTLRNSLEQSRNIPTIKIADKMGVNTILEFLERINFNAELAPDLSLALGSFGVSLLDIVSSFAIFPSGGEKVTPRSIVEVLDRDGEKVSLQEQVKSEIQQEKEVLEQALKQGELVEKNDEEKSPEQDLADAQESESQDEDEKPEEELNPFHASLGGDQVYDSRLAYIMTNLLRGVVQNGTGRRTADISRFIGGKTGTTNNYVDAWFLGFSSNLVTGVWTGFDDNDTLGWGETGSKSALPIWKDFMEAGLKRHGERDFDLPTGIINVRINKKTGRTDQAPLNFEEVFVEGTEPGARAQKDDEESEQFSPFYGDDAYYENQ